ncbi:hypothetical protein [Rhodopseudomonas palustris]|nr:hypothetical protein [Rhodopseudomonas palustris]
MLESINGEGVLEYLVWQPASRDRAERAAPGNALQQQALVAANSL